MAGQVNFQLSIGGHSFFDLVVEEVKMPSGFHPGKRLQLREAERARIVHRFVNNAGSSGVSKAYARKQGPGLKIWSLPRKRLGHFLYPALRGGLGCAAGAEMHREIEVLAPSITREDGPTTDTGRWIRHRSHLLPARSRAFPLSTP